MVYLQTVWVNWFEREKYGFNVFEYYEWHKNDMIEMIDRMPIVLIEELLFLTIENTLNYLPKKLLDIVHNQAYLRKGNENQPLPYAFIITDGEKVLAVDTLGTQIPYKKSRLIPKQERKTIDLVSNAKVKKFHFKKSRELNDYYEYANLMYGLTRKERRLKKILLKGLVKLQQTQNKNETLYWLTEWNYDKAQLLSQELTHQQLWRILFKELKDGWSKEHEKFCRKFVKGNRQLERTLELVYSEDKNKLI